MSDHTEVTAAGLAQHIERVVDQAPPLTSEQRARLALLLGGNTASRRRE